MKNIVLTGAVVIVAFIGGICTAPGGYQWGEHWIAAITKPAMTAFEQPTTGVGHIPASTSSAAKAGSTMPQSQDPATPSTQTSGK